MKRALFVTLTAVLGVVACKQSAPAPDPRSAPAVAPDKAEPARAPAAAPGSAAAADPWTKPATKKDPLAHPLFWSIEKNGVTTYALGTIHVGVDAESRLPKVVWDKLDAAKAFAMETDLSDPALMKILECSNCSLKRDLGEAYWTKLETIVTPAVASKIESMKPMVAATMMSLRGLPMTTQMDTLLLAHAQNMGRSAPFFCFAGRQRIVPWI